MRNHSFFKNEKTTWLIGSLYGLILAIFISLHATQPIFDPDFWWHLKSGEVIFKQRGLFQSDPFSFTAQPSLVASLTLNGYWLWQIIAYYFYLLFSFKGIFFLNLLTIGAILVSLGYQMHRNAIRLAVAAPLLTMGFFLLRCYPLERPQIISFLFSIILLGILNQARRSGALGVSLPIVMCIWANMHRGFAIGDVILCCFALGLVLEHRNDLLKARPLFFWIAGGIAASLINPNGWGELINLFGFISQPVPRDIAEFQSTWTEFHEKTRIVSVLWLLVFLYGTGVVLNKKINWPELFAALFLAYISVNYVRNVAFFSLTMLPSIGLVWQDAKQRWQWHFPPLMTVVTVTLSALLLLWSVTDQWKSRDNNIEVQQIYPESAIDFLKKSGLQGRMFNSYEYGGYLMWKLYPEFKVFIDSRKLDQNVYRDYDKIRFTSLTRINGMSESDRLLDQYQVDYVIQPIYDGYGNVQQLMKSLLQKEDWIPIYLDSHVFILALNTNKNRSVINSYIINKDEFKNRLLLTYDFLQRSYPNQIGFKVAHAGMLIYMGRYQEARTEIDSIAMYAPEEKMLPLLRLELNLLAGRLYR